MDTHFRTADYYSVASENVEQLKKTALSLSEEDRTYLAQELVDSLPGFEEDFDPMIRREWIDRAKLSRKEIQAGASTLTPEEVFDAIDQKIRDAR